MENMTDLIITDIRDQESFPNLDYRYSTLEKSGNTVRMSRDFIGENPLHYYIDKKRKELIAANSISAIKNHLEDNGGKFDWNLMGTVPNNRTVSVDTKTLEISEKESVPTIREYEPPEQIDYSNLELVGRKIRALLDDSIAKRLSSIKDQNIGLILSGGLDSMSVGYLLSKKGRNVTAFTMLVNEDEADIVQSRKLAQKFGIGLVEVKAVESEGKISILTRKYDKSRKPIYEKEISSGISPDDAVREAIAICTNSHIDNVLCSVSMHLIANAVKSENIKTVFCGEGPNEMINDYGFDPSKYGFSSPDKSNVRFREILTFGGGKFSKQLGGGGLGNYAVSRMSKVFAHHGIRLESPYFDRDIARIMTRVPHLTSYDTIKQHLVQNMFSEDGLDDFIMGTSKMMFQDGSGVRRLFTGLDSATTTKILNDLYGIRRQNSLKTWLKRIIPV